MDRNNQSTIQSGGGRPVSGMDAAHAIEYFDQFLNATSLKHILGYYRGLIDNIHLKPNVITSFYPKLRSNLTSWRAKALWKKFDARASHKCYQKGKLAAGTRVLIIGGGPCGMRAAIEAQLLGAKVVVIEKRDRFSRNNVLHLWPFVIEDLRMLGAKKFFGKFCAGAIDHISIRQLQCILTKVALLLGVELHTEVAFEKLIEPNVTEKTGWRAQFKPANHPVSLYEFDVVIGADGKRNTLQGFSRKEFRGKLAIAVTANFINKKTEAEARVEEISGVAFIFNQKFFKDLLAETRIDLENIVYYKDDTHYFVMTAKKASLLEKGVIKQDLADTEKLLALDNVDREALQQYAIEAANFSTNYQMPNLEFAVNHYGQPDIAMFDFTSMYAADNASKVLERHGHRLLMILVGDSLLEPFWPTGSGCARGFLSSLDAAWAIRGWSTSSYSPLDVLAERESIYRLLAQTTPDNLNKDWKSYNVDPSTRYPNLNKGVVLPHQVICLYDTDNPASIDRMKRISDEKQSEVPKKKRRGNVDNEVLLNWLSEQLKEDENINITDLSSVFQSGKVLCAIIHHYRPDLLDYNAIKNDEPAKYNQLAIDTLEKELGILPVMTGAEITNTDDYLTMASYLTEIYDTFRGEIPHIKHPKLIIPSRIPKSLNLSKLRSYSASHECKSETAPCKKCFEAYKSEIKNFSPKKPQTPEKKSISTQSSKKNVELLFVKSGTQEEGGKSLKQTSESQAPTVKKKSVSSKTHHIMSKTVSKKLERKVKKKSLTLIVEEKPKKKVSEDSKHKDLDHLPQSTGTQNLPNSLTVSSKKHNFEEECLQKIVAEKNEKLKSFMTKLLLKKKKAKLKKCNLSVIEETKNDVEGKEESKHDDVKEDIEKTQSELGRGESPQMKCECSEKKDAELAKSVNDLRNSHLSLRNFSTIFNNKHYLENSSMNSTSEQFERSMKSQEFILKTHSKGKCSYRTKSIRKFPSSESLIRIRLIEKKTRNRFTLQNIEFFSSSNQLTISSKIGISRIPSRKNVQVSTDTKYFQYHKPDNRKSNFSPANRNTMNEGDCTHNQIYSRVSNWISSNDFLSQENSKADTDIDTVISNSKITDITSVSKMDQYSGIRVEERTDVVNFSESEIQVSSEEKFAEKIKNLNNKSVRTLSKFSQYSPFQHGVANLKSASAPPTQFSVIVEGEESELPESVKMSDSFKTIKTMKTSVVQPHAANQLSRPSSRHKRHSEVLAQKPCILDKKSRKRRTLEKVGASVDHETKTSGQTFRGGGKDEDLAARIKSLENKWKDPVPIDKKPKDLLRAIGKIETSDWNIKEIEKKIMENKLGKPSKVFDKEKVPKWSKEQFLARQTKMEKQHLDRQDSVEAKYADIDKSIKNLDQKLKEGTVRELGTNKVATITEKLTSKVPPEPTKPVEKSATRPPPVLPSQGSEMCHFCRKRVYLMERLSAEGRFFHHGCFKCQYCFTQLRLGSYSFDRDGLYGYKFFCLQHFGMAGTVPNVKVTRKPSQRLAAEQRKSPEKKPLSGIAGVDLLDKVRTPERIEFSNLSAGHISSDQEDSLSQMDEDEWTDKNFGASCAELDDSDEDSSSMSDTDSDDEDAYDDALEEPVTKEGTMKWAERWKNSYSRKRRPSDPQGFSSSDQSSYYENTSDEDESETATEGEEEIRARELRKKEVCVEPPIVHTDTGTDTEVKSSSNLNSHFPDILSNHNRLSVSDIPLNRSSDNISADSADYNSAESGELDFNMNKKKLDDSNKNIVVGKLTIAKNNGADKSNSDPNRGNKPEPKSNPLCKSVTSGDLLIRRNFVVPPKENRKMFGDEFVSKFKSAEPEPLLIIKRTPSKISLPKEVGKPKVAVNTNVFDKTKYFGVEELHKPIDPDKYKQPEESSSEPEEEKVSSSIEDLLKALETEAVDLNDKEDAQEKPCENIEDLLSWMDSLEHQTKDRKVYRSFSDVKYQNLEKFLKTPNTSDCVVNKIPKNNISFFESHLSGKGLPRENSSDSDEQGVVWRRKKINLTRSKTEISFDKGNKVRKSVDLDNIEKVDIKKMLQKFETANEEPVPKPAANNIFKRNSFAGKRNSFADFKLANSGKDEKIKEIMDLSFKSKPQPIKNTIQKFEKGLVENKDALAENTNVSHDHPKSKQTSPENYKKAIDEYSFDDLEKFVQETLNSIGNKYELADGSENANPEENKWNAQVTVTTILTNPMEEDPSKEETPVSEKKSDVETEPELKTNDDQCAPTKLDAALLINTVDTCNALSENESVPPMPKIEDSKENYPCAVRSTNVNDIGSDTVTILPDTRNVPENLIINESVALIPYEINVLPELNEAENDQEKSCTDTLSTEIDYDLPHAFSRAVESTDTSVADETSLHGHSGLSQDHENKLQACETDDSSSEQSDISDVDDCEEASSETDDSDAETTESEVMPAQRNSPADLEDLSAKPCIEPLDQCQPACLETSEKKESPSQSVTLKLEHNIPEGTSVPNEEDLYAKVCKQKAGDSEQSIPIEDCPPQRPQRQKSFERRANNLDLPPEKPDNVSGCPPCAPIRRKRSVAASPVPERKLIDINAQSVSTNERSGVIRGDEVKKEVVTSYHIPKPQTVDLRKLSSDSSTSSNDKDKDCCIQ
ncbi:hypothetical protein JTB14_019871 [Gonioctena quinquepunctata]|nr:hypothetical protein JTB14_019871 [Gonioctena quinquepunctata]